jgi:hypothetical protein
MKTILLLIICCTFLLTGTFSQTLPQDTTTVAQDTLQQNEEESNYLEITLTDAEKAKVDSLISFLSAEEISGFYAKYDLWLKSTEIPEIQIQSNPEAYKTDEYYQFREYTLELGKAYIGLLIRFYQEHHTGVSHFILLSITYNDYGFLLDEVRTEFNANRYTENGDTLYYKNYNYSFAHLYFKKILALIQVSKSEQIITSAEELQKNTVKLSVYPNPAQHDFNVSIGLPNPNHVSLTIYNLTGKVAEVVCTKQYFPAGFHTIHREHRLKKGIYLVVLETQDSKQIKKIIVN